MVHHPAQSRCMQRMHAIPEGITGSSAAIRARRPAASCLVVLLHVLAASPQAQAPPACCQYNCICPASRTSTYVQRSSLSSPSMSSVLGKGQHSAKKKKKGRARPPMHLPLAMATICQEACVVYSRIEISTSGTLSMRCPCKEYHTRSLDY